MKSAISRMIAAGASAVAMATVMIVPFEGSENKVYYDVAGVPTVCHGHTGPDIIKSKTYSPQECDDLLKKDLERVKAQVDPVILVDIPEHTRAALYSFAYNVGTGAFTHSTLLRKLNASDINGACLELKRWVYAGGKKWNGLVSRRKVEEDICSYRPP